MNIRIIEIKELENGGAEVILDMDAETQKLLINFAFIELIKQNLLEVKTLWEEHENGRKNQNEG